METFMLRIAAAVAALAVGATIVHAQSTAIADRKAAFKAMAGVGKDVGAMNKGEIPFDLAKVQAALKVYSEQATKLKTLFPDDSQTGDTNVLPVAFQKKTEFLALFDKLAKDATDAGVAIKDEASKPPMHPRRGLCRLSRRLAEAGYSMHGWRF
jgi:cytochrome c556